MSDAYYLFCFARDDLIDEQSLGSGLTEDRRLLKISFKDIAMIVSKVCMEDFTGPDAEERLNNVEWVTPRALRHGRIVQEMCQLSPILPASFGTLFSSADKLIRLAELRQGLISSFLEWIKDMEEWSIKAYLDRNRLKSVLFQKRIESVEAELSKLSPGVRYFREKQIQAEVDKEISAWINDRIKTTASDLEMIAERLQLRKTTKNVFDESDSELVANWAILISSKRLDELERVVHSANLDPARDGLQLKLSGPWAPYSFAPALELETET